MSGARILPGTPIAKFLGTLDCESDPLSFLVFIDALSIGFSSSARVDSKYVRAEIEYALKETAARLEQGTDIDTLGFLKALAETEGRLVAFNPWSWERNEDNADNY